jgi:hypothetical protein
MARRSGVLTGFGNSDPELMDGQSTGSAELDKKINECAKECYELFFKGTQLDYEAIDAGANDSEITFGLEPSYFGDPLKVIRICGEKKWCNFETGLAKGYWGSGIRSTKKHYFEYKYSSKFTRFIDKWHPILFKEGA